MAAKHTCPRHGFELAKTEHIHSMGWLEKCPLVTCRHGSRLGWAESSKNLTVHQAQEVSDLNTQFGDEQ